MNIDRDGLIDLGVIKSVSLIEGEKLQSGDVLFNNTNSAELIGKTAIVSTRESGFAFSNHMTRIRPEKGIQPAFIARQLHFLWMMGYMKHRCTHHVNQASISSKTLANTIPILLPATAEQTRIVEKLEELLSDLDAGVSELKAAQKKLALYRQSMLKAAVEGALTAEWRKHNTPAETGAQLLERILTERRARWEAKQLAKFEEQGKTPPQDWKKRYPEPVQPDATNLPELPEGWVWASVEQVAEVLLGKMLDKTKHISGVKLPYLRNINIRWGYIDTSDLLEMFFETDELDRYGLVSGDVLVCEGGEPGRAAVCRAEHSHMKYQKALHRVRLFGFYEPELLVIVLEYLSKTGKLDNSFTGSTIKHFTKESLIPLNIPLPSQSEQREIVEQLLSAYRESKNQDAVISCSLKQSVAQRQNILRAAFSGQLVPQDPNDEPASVLLERIRAEREERAKQPKPRKPKQQKKIAAMSIKLIDVLAEASDWMPAQEAFRRCGVGDGAQTDQIEALYAELRALDKAGRLQVDPVTDAQHRKLYDRLKLVKD
mgnify:CR=1 FL=1